MKTIIAAAAIAAFGFVGSASAQADMRVRGARYAAPVYDWSGFYVGGAIGWQGSRIGLANPVGTLSYNPNHDSFAYGAFLGVQRQFGQVVLGIEGGYLAATGEANLGTTPSVSIFFPGGTGTAQARLRDIWSVGGRVGWSMAQWMPYFTAGYGSGSFRFNAQSAGITEEARASTGGYYIGGGLDWALTRNWIFGVEYRHYEFDDKAVASTTSTGFSESIRFSPRTDTVLARVSYKFDWMWR